MRILFITSSRLAEAVISCGVLEQLRTTYPKARITVVCGARSAGLFSRLPRLARIIIASKSGGQDFYGLRLWTRLVSRFWDVAVDMRGSAITRFLPIGRRYIVRIRKGGRLYKQFGEAMRFSPPPLPVIWTAAADRAEAERRLADGTPFIGLGPTAGLSRKVWPAERFIETYHKIAKLLPGSKVVIFTGAGDCERLSAADMGIALPDAMILPASLSLPLLGACMARLRLYIGNDNSLLHLAAAAGAPTLGLFGRSRADEYAPAGLHAAAVAAAGPHGDAAMEGLTVDAVFAAAKKLLRE